MPLTFSGIVTQKQFDKTATVSVKQTKIHRLYKKRYQVTRQFLAHDPKNTLVVGQEVTLHQSRPISRLKHWLAIAKKPK